MLDFKRADLQDFSVHYVGNKGNGEEISLSNKPFKFKDEFVKDTLFNYFLTPFKNDIYYQFRKGDVIKIFDVHAYAKEIFEDKKMFFKNSVKIAQHLFDQSNHPKIKGGELYLAYFRDCMVDGELCDAIGIFKSENKETYLKVYEEAGDFEIETENGININKLDKGCLIYNTDRDSGYKVSLLDNSTRVAEVATYWMEDFLNLKLREDNYYHTQHLINSCKGFCDEVLTEDNNVSKLDQQILLNRSVNFLREKDNFKMKEFQNEVLAQPELIEAYKDFRKQYNKENQVKPIDDFQVSATAVNQNKKYMRSILKLDKNFHIYVHSRHDYIQKGYDEDMGMHFYKLYFSKEE